MHGNCLQVFALPGEHFNCNYARTTKARSPVLQRNHRPCRRAFCLARNARSAPSMDTNYSGRSWAEKFVSNQKDFAAALFWVITFGEWKEIERVHKFGMLNSQPTWGQLKECLHELPGPSCDPFEKANNRAWATEYFIFPIYWQQRIQVTYGPAHFLCHFGPDKRCQTDADNVPRMSNVLQRTHLSRCGSCPVIKGKPHPKFTEL